MSLWGKSVERASSKFTQWLATDGELFPYHTCRMVTSVVQNKSSGKNVMSFFKTLEVEYTVDGKKFQLMLKHERAVMSLEDMLRDYKPGEEDGAGVYWDITSDTEFVAFRDMPDIKTAVKYIDTVYGK